MSEADPRPVIALTMGDPAGVGPEICLRVVADPLVLQCCVPVIFGSAAVLERVARACGLGTPRLIGGANDRRIAGEAGVVDCGEPDGVVEPGTISAACGLAAYRYLGLAVERALRHEVAALATAPINKAALHAAGVRQPGHTEILAALTRSPSVCMMLASDTLTVSFVTTHIGLGDVAAAIRRQRVREVIQLTEGALRELRGERLPIAVCGLNPHAGESGLFGRREEETEIQPAIEEARAAGCWVEGPLPPDTAFVPERAARYGAIVCMYHDQGHIPFKMLAFDTGVNITLGLPIIRTSVDHGTAFDIAWQGRARATSMRQAVLYAARMARGVPR